MELLLMLIKLISRPRLDATALKTKEEFVFLEDKFVVSRAEASPGDMILMRHRFVALEILQQLDGLPHHHYHLYLRLHWERTMNLIPEQLGLCSLHFFERSLMTPAFSIYAVVSPPSTTSL